MRYWMTVFPIWIDLYRLMPELRTPFLFCREADRAIGNAFEGGARSVRARLNLADGSEYVRYYAHDYDYYWYGHFLEEL